jgi:hypothetical protein
MSFIPSHCKTSDIRENLDIYRFFVVISIPKDAKDVVTV